MTCGSKYDSGNCVADILRDIADAQTDLVSDCTTSCEQSIADLLGEASPADNFDTVPVILYCKGNCKPFKGYGARRPNLGFVFSSFYFRVKSVDEDNCAVLELLREPGDESNPHDPVDQDTSDLEVTGVCITVDLDCFCHVTCLPAINALD
ncbi:CotY/CotZ family spore coat protein [Aquibacillus koreensis]|uniref:CotY/CotZ family spore coat protein n=1 Tax=Aquibacillus koreensis TaxID=279446 RepID=A0A9X3WJG7_9BACI|nr:CotY/CotZ family spore coat protein [Aquibacillus koreensis]MCT2535672.1 CotY/CotZ family spore coat protein [Aquibacillus koreensis]MDC3420043.1 CotY/CotZ family spore coat protein [Aquibacillus koreensis]